jgi:hypothetical protein
MVRFDPETKRVEFSPGTSTCVREGLYGVGGAAVALMVAWEHTSDPTKTIVWRVLAAGFFVLMLMVLKRSVWLVLFTHRQQRVELWLDRIVIRKCGIDWTIPLESIETVEHLPLDEEDDLEPVAIIKLRSGRKHWLGRDHFEFFGELARFSSLANDLLGGTSQPAIQPSEVATDSGDDRAEPL